MVTDSLYKNYISQEYKDFSRKLSPSDTLERAGVSIPSLRKIAKEISPDDIEIKYHEDVILKGLAIGNKKAPFEEKIDSLNNLLPFLSSWDHTDTIQSAFKPSGKDKEAMLEYFKSLLNRKEVFARRLGIVWLMSNRKAYDSSMVLDLIIASDSENEYYIMMAVAWALSCFYFDNHSNATRLNDVSATTQKKAIAKIKESRMYKGENIL